MIALSFRMLALTLCIRKRFGVSRSGRFDSPAMPFPEFRAANRPDPVRRGGPRRRLRHHGQPRGAAAGNGRAADPRQGRGGDARARLCAEPDRGRARRRAHQIGRSAGADHRQFDLCRHRAGPVRRAGAARLRRDPGAVALRCRARGSRAVGAAVAPAGSHHHGGIARDRGRCAAVAPRRHSDRGDMGAAARADRRGRGL